MNAKIKILKDGVRGADDGATVRDYPKDGVFTVSETLAAVMIEAGEAEEIVEEKQTVTERVKAKTVSKPAGLPPIPGKK